MLVMTEAYNSSEVSLTNAQTSFFIIKCLDQILTRILE